MPVSEFRQGNINDENVGVGRWAERARHFFRGRHVDYIDAVGYHLCLPPVVYFRSMGFLASPSICEWTAFFGTSPVNTQLLKRAVAYLSHARVIYTELDASVLRAPTRELSMKLRHVLLACLRRSPSLCANLAVVMEYVGISPVDEASSRSS